MREQLPAAYDELLETIARLEAHYRDMQDIEFTVEDDRLYLLQTRTAKRTAAASLKAAVDMEGEGLISREEAVARIDPAQLDQLLHPMIDPTARSRSSPRASTHPRRRLRKIVFDAGRKRSSAGWRSVILVRWETTPDDIHGLIHARGVLTAHGGMTSHAAVVARGMGKPCVAGCEGLAIDVDAGVASLNGHDLAEGDLLTIDGHGPRHPRDRAPRPPQINENLETVLEWADGLRRLGVRANADTEDAAKARELGAEGIGLCRTEHMFMVEQRLPVMREMIMADSTEGRRSALERILPMQQADFEGILEAMAGTAGDDPPARSTAPRVPAATRRSRRRAHARAHPCAPGGKPDARDARLPRRPDLPGDLRDAGARDRAGGPGGARSHGRASSRSCIRSSASARSCGGCASSRARRLEEDALDYLVGTMIELPRACVQADEIAEHADFFSFGTNDLTQTALGFSRRRGEQVPRPLPRGRRARAQPLRDARRGRVGDLMRIAVARGRDSKPELKLGICGEHGGDPRSVAFCHAIGLDYVSCSPYRVPLARLAAAQAALAEEA